jgi:hypothetical protein
MAAESIYVEIDLAHHGDLRPAISEVRRVKKFQRSQITTSKPMVLIAGSENIIVESEICHTNRRDFFPFH